MMSPNINGEAEHEDTADAARPRWSRKQWALVALGVAVLTTIAALYGLGAASQPVRWQDVGYSIDSATEATVTFEVYLYSDQPVTCYVHAMNVQYAEVGVSQVDVFPADGAQQRFTLPINTVEEANTAVVQGCGPLE